MRRVKFFSSLLLTFVLGAAIALFAACDSGIPTEKPTITFAETNVTMFVGDSKQIDIEVVGEGEVEVTVAPEGIVSYSDGTLTALKKGIALVTAQVGDVKASMQVTVNEKPIEKVSVTVGESVTVVEVGSKLSAPSTPTKESTAQYEYQFDGWYFGDKKWDFGNDVVMGEMTLEARFSQSVRKYEVNINGVFSEAEYGSRIEKPADPEKQPTATKEYVFDKWVIFGTDTEWNFNSDIVTGNVALEPTFTEKEREFSYTYALVSGTTVLMGKTYENYKLSDEDFTVTVYKDEKEYATPEVKDLQFTVTGVRGTYDVKIDYKGTVIGKSCRLQTDGGANIVVEKPMQLGGSAGDLASFGSNYTVEGNSITLTNVTYAYIGGEEPTDTLYMEAHVAFNSGIGQMVGFMAAAEHKPLGGAEGAKKLLFSYSYGNRFYYQEVAGWSGNGITDFVSKVYYIDQSFAPITGCKIAVARKGYDYYLFLNDKLMGHYYSETFGKGDFGFANTGGAINVKFSDVAYTVDSSVVDDILGGFTTEIAAYGSRKTYLGGSFAYPNGARYASFGNGWELNDYNSGFINPTSYLYATDAVGSVYYQEVTLSKEDGWTGLLVNTLDGEPQQNKGWYGYGVYTVDNASLLFFHVKDNWHTGDPKGAINLGSGKTFKLGVARVNDVYYVFINGALVLQEQHKAFKTSNHAVELPADNPSGMGIFRGGNISVNRPAQKVAFTDYRYTFDINEIKALIGGEATISCGENIAMTQNGLALNEGDKLIPNVPVNITINVPEGKVISKYSLTLDGNNVDVSLSGNSLVFYPKDKGEYVASVQFADKGTGTINLKVKSVEREVDNTAYALYSMDVDWAKVNVSLLNLTTAKEITSGIEGATKTFANIESGYYKLSISYNSMVYAQYVTIAAGETLDINGYVSNAYLGGNITIPNAQGNATTYNSFDNASPTATSGSAWALVDGKRDTIRVTNYTYAFQHQFSGTKYYVEGTFNTEERTKLGSNFGGLLVAHGPNNLSGKSDKKFGVSIFGKSIIGTYIPDNWSPLNTFVIANFADMGIKYDLNAVRLGVVRDGTKYLFFVNDVYVGDYLLPEITNESGIGVMASASVNITISNFNYSANEQLINAYKAKAPVRENKQIDLYLVAGQSNAAGCTNVVLDTAESKNPNYVFGYNNVWYAGSAGANYAHDVKMGLARVGLGENDHFMGPEAGMAETLSEYYNTESGKEAVIVKYAVGGTALQDNVGGLNASDGNWCPPSYFKTHNKASATLSGGLYDKLLKEFDEQWAHLVAMGYSPVVKGMYWMQGEADKGQPEKYLEIFKMFAADIRSDLSSHSGQDCSQMPIFIGEISRTSGDASPGTVATNEGFIAMQKTIPNHVANTYVIEIGDFDINKWNGYNVVVGSDSWHWNWQDALTIGNMVGRSIIQNVLSK